MDLLSHIIDDRLKLNILAADITSEGGSYWDLLRAHRKHSKAYPALCPSEH